MMRHTYILFMVFVTILVLSLSAYTSLAAPPRPIAPPPTDRLQPHPPDRLHPPRPPRVGSNLIWATYRLGDSPLDANGVPEWTKPEARNEWQRMPIEKNTEIDSEYSWFSTMLPLAREGKPVDDPYLMFTNASYEFELYSGTKLLYQNGDLDDHVTSLQEGMIVFISLEGHSDNELLFLRIHSKSDNVLVGKIGPVAYDSQVNLKLRLIKGDTMNGFSLLVFFIIGLMSLLMYFINRDNRATLYFAIFSLMLCCSLLFSLKSPALFMDLSTIRMYMVDPLHGAMVLVFVLYFVHILKPVFENLIRVLGVIIFAFGLLMPVAKLLFPTIFDEFGDRIIIIERLGFSVLCAFCLIVIAISFRRQVSNDAKWFIAGFSLFLIINMVGYPLRLFLENNLGVFEIAPIQFIRLVNVCLDYSLLVSTFFFGVISFKRYIEVYRKMREYNYQLTIWNQSLESKVEERTQSIQNLLDYAGQGFLTFDKQLIVQGEYSIECQRVFERDIADCRYVELLYAQDAAEQELHEEILASVFQEDELRRGVCLSLLPTETEVLGKKLALQYTWIPGIEASTGKVMVILTDITERRRLENQMAREKRVLQMIVWVIKHYRDFKDMVEEYRSFALSGKSELLQRNMPLAETWVELSRIIHTFKGNFAQVDFVYTTEKLHELESQLAEWQERIDDQSTDPLITLLAEWLEQYDLLGWLDEDLRILREILGNQFDIGHETITIEIERLRHMEQQVYSILPSSEAEAIVLELRRLQYRPFNELLGMYPEYTVKLAERIGKEIHPVHITGGEMLVNPDVYMDFVRTLIHVFRNMVDHGIETPEERASMGKERFGTVECDISDNEQGIQLFISNNGRKMDLLEIRTLAIDKGICSATQFDAMSTNEQRMLIFHDGFTTKKSISELSGRGVGLSAVRKATEDLKGTVWVDSDSDSGTTFTFILPRLD